MPPKSSRATPRGFRDEPLSDDVLHHAKRAVVDWYASLYPGLDAPAVQALELVLADDLDRGAARLARGRAATPARCGPDPGHRGACRRGRRQLPRRDVPPGCRDHRGRARRGAVGRRERCWRSCAAWCSATRSPRASASRWAARTTSTGTTPARWAASALPPLPAALLGLDEAAFAHALAMAGTFTAGLAAGLPLGSDGQAAARRPRRGGRAAGGATGGARRAQFARHPRWRGRPGPSHEHRARLVAGRRHARPGLPHHPAHLQEPHRLRTHLPCRRRRARAAAAARLHARRHRSHPSGRVPGHAGHRAACRVRRTPTRHGSACTTWWPRRWCTAACGCPRSAPSG